MGLGAPNRFEPRGLGEASPLLRSRLLICKNQTYPLGAGVWMEGGKYLTPQPRATPFRNGRSLGDCDCRTKSVCSCVLLASWRRDQLALPRAVSSPDRPATRGRSVDSRQMSPFLSTLEAEWELRESRWSSQRPSLARRGHFPLPGTHRSTSSFNLLGQSRHTSEVGAVILPVLLSPREGVLSKNTQVGRGRTRIRTQAG